MKLYVCVCVADCEGLSVETWWRRYWGQQTSNCRWWSYGAALVRMRAQGSADRGWATDRLHKVTRWVLSIPWEYYSHISGDMRIFYPLGQSSKSRLITIKQRVICFLLQCQKILFIVWPIWTLCYTGKHWMAQNSQISEACNDSVAWNRQICI